MNGDRRIYNHVYCSRCWECDGETCVNSADDVRFVFLFSLILNFLQLEPVNWAGRCWTINSISIIPAEQLKNTPTNN